MKILGLSEHFRMGYIIDPELLVELLKNDLVLFCSKIADIKAIVELVMYSEIRYFVLRNRRNIEIGLFI